MCEDVIGDESRASNRRTVSVGVGILGGGGELGSLLSISALALSGSGL